MSIKIRTSQKRSLVKAFTYRLIIICLDLTCVYLLTGKLKMAFGFMILSNLYMTVCYFLHERLWSRIAWGLQLDGTKNLPPS